MSNQSYFKVAICA